MKHRPVTRKRPLIAVLAAVWMSCFALQFSSWASSENRVIEVDYEGSSRTLTQTPNRCVGAGRANEGLRADWQQQLMKTKQDCGFEYLRFHGLLCDDMGVYKINEHGEELYNWQYVDALFDAMLEMDIRPFVELGFMPSGLASGPSTIFWWRGNVTPPRDYEQWSNFIKALITHWEERYGKEALLTWYFEVWNEPNLSGFWIGDKKGMSDEAFAAYAQSEYFKLYETTARAVKAVDERYRVGGPATAGNDWIPEIIEYCEQKDAPLDFVSTHHYGVEAGFLDEWGNTGTVLSANGNTISDAVHKSRSEIDTHADRPLELHYTEWSTSYTPSDPVHDSYHSASYILHNLKAIGDVAQSMSYWTFTDIFEEAGPRFTPFHGGFGLTNYQGIHKPAYFAYKFFNQLGPIELDTEDSESWITKDEQQGFQALFWDFKLTRPEGEINNQAFFNTDLPAEDAAPVTLKVSNMAPGKYTMKAYKVGYRANDAYTAYLDLGSPRQLTRQQVKDLKAASDGEPFAQETIVVGSKGAWVRKFPLQENDVVLVVCERI